MAITGLDHMALPTDDAERFAAFYRRLGFTVHGLEAWRAGTAPLFSIGCGDQKVNVHPETLTPIRGNPAYLRGDTAVAGCGDLCVVWEGGVAALLEMLEGAGVPAIEGPVPRLGGRGGDGSVGISVYVRDLDHNLLEFISYDSADVEHYGEEMPTV